jgi:hypothetical protein
MSGKLTCEMKVTVVGPSGTALFTDYTTIDVSKCAAVHTAILVPIDPTIHASVISAFGPAIIKPKYAAVESTSCLSHCSTYLGTFLSAVNAADQ